jgi:ABC-type transport system involved in cytochrome bd biosynthesis fused ATPase/permease subunit
MPLARPIARWVSELRLFARLRGWIVSLGPYPTLVLFAVPLIVLEPVKLVAAYLVGTGFFASGMALLAGGELLKLVLVERLFNLSRDKLMSIPAFAWAYRHYRQAVDWVQATEAWQMVRRVSLIVKRAVRGTVQRFRAALRSTRSALFPR